MLLLLLLSVAWVGESFVSVSSRRSKRISASRVDLEELVQRKLREAAELHRQHNSIAESDIRKRLSFAASEGGVRFARSMRRKIDEEKGMAIVADVKRNRLDGTFSGAKFSDAAAVAQTVMTWPIDAVSIGLDAYGGTLMELKETRKRLGVEVPILSKELIVDPIQIAIAAECGADAVVLLAQVLGSRLEDLLDAATIMGVEAVVEVHTPDECRYALEAGATILLANNYDRIENQMMPRQARGLKDLIPPNIVSIATGGIRTFDQAAALGEVGYDAVLLGTAIIGSPPAESKPLVKAIRELTISPLQNMLF